MLGGSHIIFIPRDRSTKVATMLSYLIRLLENRSNGQGLAEYALILGLIAVTAIAALMFMGTRVSAILSTISNKL